MYLKDYGAHTTRTTFGIYYLFHGQLHREDGPAIEWANGYVQYALYDTTLTRSEWETQMKKIKAKKQINSSVCRDS